MPSVKAGIDRAQIEVWHRMMKNYRENLLLMEERMSEYVEFTAIPLQLVKSKRQTEARLMDNPVSHISAIDLLRDIQARRVCED